MKTLLLAATAAAVITAPAFAQEETRFVFRAKASVISVAPGGLEQPPAEEEEPFGEVGRASVRVVGFQLRNQNGDQLLRPGTQLEALIEIHNGFDTAISDMVLYADIAQRWSAGNFDRAIDYCDSVAAGSVRSCTLVANVGRDICEQSTLAVTTIPGGGYVFVPDHGDLTSASPFAVNREFTVDASSCGSAERLSRDDLDFTDMSLTFRDQDGDGVLSIGDQVRFSYEIRNDFQHEVAVQMGVGLPTGFSDKYPFIPGNSARSFEHVIEATSENLAALRRWQTPENGSTHSELFAYISVYSVNDEVDWENVDIFDEFAADPLRVPLWGDEDGV